MLLYCNQPKWPSFSGVFMAGRKAFVLTANDVNALKTHILNLPFKRKVEQRFLDMMIGKKAMSDFSVEDLDLIKKCRYERNAYLKQMTALDKIALQPSPTRFEQDILDLAKRTDIDAHFLKLDALRNYLKQEDQKKLEIKLRNEKKRIEQKELKTDLSQKKQRDRENYYLGAICRKLLATTKTHDHLPNDLKRLEQVFIDSGVITILRTQHQPGYSMFVDRFNAHPNSQHLDHIFNEIDLDTRNPFKGP